MKTLDDVMQDFLQFSPFDMKGKYELTRIRHLMELLGDPQDKMPVIHVAGTSGKTSTSYFIRALLEEAGQKTGLTVSPHITGINERVQLSGKPLAPEVFTRYAEGFLAQVAKTELQPTYFELLIALAYTVFAKERVNYAVIETGLGGLLDGTNVVMRADKLCIITDIGLDHTEILGDTIEKIALQKAGIIQPGNHVIMHRQAPEVMRVFEKVAVDKRATLRIIEPLEDGGAPDFLPPFQARNFVLARAAYDYLQKRDRLPELSEVQLKAAAHRMPPGRFEVYNHNDKTIILDGAHNAQKLEALRESLAASGITSAAFLCNLVQAPEPKVVASLEVIKPVCSYCIIPEFNAGQDLKSRRSFAAEKMSRYMDGMSIPNEQQPDIQTALRTLLNRPERTLVITGSLYLVSAIRPYLKAITN